jgi:hypothetical protein
MIEKEKVKTSSNCDIMKLVRRAILNDGANRTRILYAGVNPSNPSTIAVHKVIEIFRGKYFFEETIVNPSVKSIHTTLTSISKEKFYGIVPAKEKMHDLEFYPNPQIVAATSYARELQNGKGFFNVLYKDFRNNKTFTSPICDIYTKWRINKFLLDRFKN